MSEPLTLRAMALALAALSAGAMLYIGLYQSRALKRMWCPLFADGCEKVADADFAKPFGVPDGYLGFALYLIIAALLLAPAQGGFVSGALLVLTVLGVIANAIGVWDMITLGAFCFYCFLTAVTSPILVWLAWLLG